MDVNGSPEYDLTWSHWDMPSGPPICRLRGWPRRTSVSVCFGWPTTEPTPPGTTPSESDPTKESPSQSEEKEEIPLAGYPTPTAADGDRTSRGYMRGNPTLFGAVSEMKPWPTAGAVSRGAKDPETIEEQVAAGRQFTLEDAAALAGWPTAIASEFQLRQDLDKNEERRQRALEKHGTKPGLALAAIARMSGWPTPKAGDGNRSARTLVGAIFEIVRKPGNNDLGALAMLAGWTTPVTIDGRRGTDTGGHNPLNLSAQCHLAPIAPWITPQAHDAKGGSGDPERLERHGTEHGCSNLVDLVKMAEMAGWTTPMASEPTKTTSRPSREATGRTTEYLGRQVLLIPWATPIARDSKSEKMSPEVEAKYANRMAGKPLSRQALGIDSMSSPAETERHGALAPEFVRWLQGYPVEWGFCGAMATR